MASPGTSTAGRPAKTDDLGDWRGDLRNLWLRAWIAANKAAALLVAVGIHKAIDVATVWLIPHGWGFVSKLFRGTFFVVFAIIYFHLMWEMLTAFVPSFRKKTWVKEKTNGAAV